MTGHPLRVLCLDIEGGFGGSSRSLFEFVRHLDRRAVEVEVWCRKEGPIQPRYREIGVETRIVPAMPKVSSLPRISRNLYAYGLALCDFLAAGEFRRDLAEAANHRFDVIHFNHEALFLSGRWLRPRTKTALTMHIRTNLHDTPFARWQERAIAGTMDHLVFITENERTTVERLAARPANGSVIHNIVPPAGPIEPSAAVPQDERFKIACVSSYSWYRGIDRLIETAEILAGRGRRDVLFVVAGNMALTRSLPGELGAVARRGGTLVDYAKARGVEDMFLFLGHVKTPEAVLAACDALAKPTRENNPWGRDILEALAAGLPVFSVGRDETFVETGITGFLQPEFDRDALADEIVRLADDRGACVRMGAAGRERVLKLCDGPARAADLLEVWQSTANKNN